jgi:hypothetical protein
MEVNISPSLSSSSPFDKVIKNSLMTDIFHCIGIRPAYKKNIKKSKLNVNKKKKISTTNNKMNSMETTNRNITRLKTSNLLSYPLSNIDLNLLRDMEDEYERRGSFRRIFPLINSYEKYAHLFECERYNNILISKYIKLTSEQAFKLIIPTNKKIKLLKCSIDKNNNSKRNSLSNSNHSLFSRSLSSTSPSLSSVSISPSFSSTHSTNISPYIPIRNLIKSNLQKHEEEYKDNSYQINDDEYEHYEHHHRQSQKNFHFKNENITPWIKINTEQIEQKQISV